MTHGVLDWREWPNWATSEWLSAGAGVASAMAATVAIFIAVASLKKQESTHASELAMRRIELSHHTFLEMDKLYHELNLEDADPNSDKAGDFLNFFERVGYYVSNGMMNQEIVDVRWGDVLRGLPKMAAVKEEFHLVRCTLGRTEAWVNTEALVQALLGTKEPIWPLCESYRRGRSAANPGGTTAG